MNEETRAAAERLLKRTDRTTQEFFQLEEDAELLARTYLSEHPADSELDITTDWLRSMGFVGEDCKIPMRHAGYDGYLSWHNVYAFLTQYDSEDPEENSCVQVACKTRGDMRRLCAFLNIPLQEQP